MVNKKVFCVARGDTIELHNLRFTDLESRLFQQIEQFEVIDAHEHIPPERMRLEHDPLDAFMFVTQYTVGDLLRAGMPQNEYQKLFDSTIPLDVRWQKLEPYWKRIRHGSFAHAVRLALQKFYGVDDLTAETVQPISDKVKKMTTAGIYHRILRDTCNIRLCLTQCNSTQVESSLFAPLMWIDDPWTLNIMETWANLNRPFFEPDAHVNALSDYLDAKRAYIRRSKAEGAVGMKMMSHPFGKPDYAQAIDSFNALRDGKIQELPTPNPLRDYIMDQSVAMCRDEGLPIAVHTGYWMDFRRLDPLHMIPVFDRYPDVRFDVYHLGYPWTRQTLMLGKGFSNVWINFCWMHVISQRCATEMMDEAIDILPINKIIGFGGDYSIQVEKVWGHLVMARENITRVLAHRIERGDFSEDEALKIARMWLFDNACDLYDLKVRSDF